MTKLDEDYVQLKAMRQLNKMSKKEFDKFFKSLPKHTQLLLEGGMCSDTTKTLADWYIYKQKNPIELPYNDKCEQCRKLKYLCVDCIPF